MRGVVVHGGEHAGPVIAQTRDHVETHALTTAAGLRVFGEPGGGTAPKSRLLARVDGLGGAAVTSESTAPAAASRLHLDEHEGAPDTGDQVDLDPGHADVASDDLIPSRFEMTRGALFPLAAEGSPNSGHARAGLLDRDGARPFHTARGGRGRRRIEMGTLHIVATPIGHLEDVTLRALRVLREADWVLAEDTRRTRVLLDHFEIAQRPTSLHAHNEAGRIDSVLDALTEGKQVALVSDAGTPLVSDPGERLVAAAVEAGHRVEAVPGPSALLTALTVSGLSTERVLFLGFLPRKAGARRKVLEAQRGRSETLVLFESPRRVATTLAEVGEILGPRRACLARELTKQHEEVLRDEASALAARLEAVPPRGECTLVIEGADEDEEAAIRAWSDEDVDLAIAEALEAGRSVKDVATEIAGSTGRKRRALYARAVELRDLREPRRTEEGDA